jgi:muconolactone delta-isomerase
MKFLVMQRRRDGVPIPPDVIAGLLRAQSEYLDEQVRNGTVDVAYGLPQGGGGLAIVNADSAESLNEILAASPLFGVTNIEVQPLADIHATLAAGASAMQRMVAVPA